MPRPMILAATIALTALSTKAISADPGPIVLENGATLIVDPTPGIDAVGVIAAYAAGYTHDPAGLTQAAHLAEHLRVTAGLGDTPPGASAARLNELGSANAETLANLTYYDFALPPEQLGLAFETEAARLTGLRITDADMAREIPRMRQEIEAVVSAPGVFVGKFATMAAVQVWLHGAKEAPVRVATAPAADTMRAFVDAHHRVDRLTIIVTGDVDQDRAEALFREHIGPIAKPGTPGPDAGPALADLPELQRVPWDVAAKVILVALPHTEADWHTQLEAVAARATFALSQHRLIRSTVASGPGTPIGPLPLFVGVCLHPDADEDAALDLLHQALDGAAATDADQARTTARFISTPQPKPTADAVRTMAGQLAAQRGMAPHVAAAMIVANHALQSFFRAPHPDGGLGNDDLNAAIRRAFARDHRRVLILTPPK